LRHKVKFLVGKEARDAIKESKRVKEGETERLAMMTGEDAKEIKKELSVYVDDTVKARCLLRRARSSLRFVQTTGPSLTGCPPCARRHREYRRL
jgi:hypothetical protein